MGFNNNNNNRNFYCDQIDELMVRSDVCDVLRVFKGKYRAANVAKYSRRRLESAVSRLVTITSRRKENYGKPKWWPNEVIYTERLQDLKKLVPNSVWNQMLRKLLALCWQFYDGEKLCEKNKTRKKRVLQEVQQHHSFQPVVCLRDILKPCSAKKVCKSSFIKSLSLVPVGGSHDGGRKEENLSTLFSKPIRLTHVPNVPFSSDYGQVLMKREKMGSLEEAHLKRLERIERYLKNDSGAICPNADDDNGDDDDVDRVEYPVTYDKKEDFYCHIYRFPVRQAYQIQDKITFLKGLCRPVSVILERYDVPRRKKKVLKVVLTRCKITCLRLRNGRKAYN